MRKFFTYPVFFVLFLSFIGVILFGSILRHHYEGGEKFQFLQNVAVTIAAVPHNINFIIKEKTFNLNKPPSLKKHKDKENFVRFIKSERNLLYLLPRYDHSLSKAFVDIIDVNNFEKIHSYSHDIKKMTDQISDTKKKKTFKIDNSPIRFRYENPILLDDGSVIDNRIIASRIDFCSNLMWINDEVPFHHSLMMDLDKNLWVGGMNIPKTQYVKNYLDEKKMFDLRDDSIVKLNINGEILFNKSVIEILIENNLIDQNILESSDPIHLNDIEPTFSDTNYWKKGDVFLSIRNQSAIIHYRPKDNKVINYIKGPFALQHDVDVISEKEISIFNNNNLFINNENSEIIIYNFETKQFNKLFNNQIIKENIKTQTGGLSHTLKDGSLIIEEHNHGRVIFFNKYGQKEWEFVNKDDNGIIGNTSWGRIIEDEIFIKKFKTLAKSKKC